MAYERVNWKDYPDTTTPVTATNLNNMDEGIADAHTLIAQKANSSDVTTSINTINTALNGKAASNHNHDSRYYTETEVNNLLSGKSATSHTHDDRYYTESEVNSLLGGKAAASHTHDDRYYTETEVNNLLNNKADKSSIGTKATMWTNGTTLYINF